MALCEVERTFCAGRGRRATRVTALRGLSLRVRAGEVVAVVGPSGCGKTTLLELVCGLQRPDGGTVRAAPAVLMPQRDLLLPWLDALDNAGLARRVGGASREEARTAARPLFAAFGLEGFEGHRPAALSGGMRQRVAFLRTLLAGKPVLCLDEPFGALDALTRAEMRSWLAGALATGPGEERAWGPASGDHGVASATPRTWGPACAAPTTLLVTHDIEEALVLADRVAVLSPRPGRVVAEYEVAVPRPRRATDPALVALRERVTEALWQA